MKEAKEANHGPKQVRCKQIRRSALVVRSICCVVTSAEGVDVGITASSTEQPS